MCLGLLYQPSCREWVPFGSSAVRQSIYDASKEMAGVETIESSTVIVFVLQMAFQFSAMYGAEETHDNTINDTQFRREA